MKKLIVLVALLAFVPILVPANADALTLRQRVSRLKGKINCLRRIPVISTTISLRTETRSTGLTRRTPTTRRLPRARRTTTLTR
jgi:hypothetical protein